MNINDEIQKAKQEAQAKLKEADRLAALLATYPDVQKHVGRWNKVAYSSKSVNGIVTGVELRHNCGCCNDSPLEAWPYLETEHGRVYSNPSCYQVGEKHWIAGDRPYDGWKEALRVAGIPETIIEKIARHFKASAEERRQMAEDSDYDDED